MSKKKAWLIAVCAALILLMSALGTIAYFTDMAEANNTFIVGKLLEDPSSFVLKEHKATDPDMDGIYELGNEEVTENTYDTVLPGVNVKKDPFVKTTETLKMDAYIFIEVVDETGTALSFEVDGEYWTELTGATGSHGGEIYYLSSGVAKEGSALGPVSILKNNEIVVADVEITDAEEQFGGTVTFYSYMIQAPGFNSASEAWTKGFAENAD